MDLVSFVFPGFAKCVRLWLCFSFGHDFTPEGSRLWRIYHAGNDQSHQLPSSFWVTYGYNRVPCPSSGQEREGADAPPGSYLLFVEMAPVQQPWTKRDVGCKRTWYFAVRLESNKYRWEGSVSSTVWTTLNPESYKFQFITSVQCSYSEFPILRVSQSSGRSLKQHGMNMTK